MIPLPEQLQGQLLHQTQDEHGSIQVVDLQQRMRSLHFGNGTSQSGMFLHHPDLLLHKYTQALLTPLCFHTVQRVCILGLGAGSIAKYLLHFFPHIDVDAVELRSSVIDIAIDFFSLPENNPRLNIIHQAAQDFLAQTRKCYDLIIVDLFLTDDKKKDIQVNLGPHFDQASSRLEEDGCLCMNIIGQQPENYIGFETLSQAFDHNIRAIDVDSTNTILMTSRQPLNGLKFHSEMTSLEKKTQLPFRQYFNKIRTI